MQKRWKRILLILLLLLVVAAVCLLAVKRCGNGTMPNEEDTITVPTMVVPKEVEDTLVAEDTVRRPTVVVTPRQSTKENPLDTAVAVQGWILSVGGVRYELVPVKAGSFMMGTPDEDAEANPDERPAHRVTLTRDFCIGSTEVTQALYEAVMGYNPSANRKGGDYPVENVSYQDAMRFCQRLSQLTGDNYSLPTEAQWEYAARGGHLASDRSMRYAGSGAVDDVAWWFGNSDNASHPVARKAPNSLGLYDMSGNVYEWCLDWYGKYSSADEDDPTGPATGDSRCIRGGSWYFFAEYCRIANRNGRVPTHHDNHLGFRIVMLL